MEEGRIHLIKKRPNVVLDKRFSFSKDLDIGDKGQLDMTIDILGCRVEPDHNGDDRKIFTVKIIKAKKVNL